MKLTLLAWLATVCCAGQTFGIEDYAKIARIADVQVAPGDRSAIVVVSRPNYTDNVWESELVRVDFSGGQPKELTHRKSARSPRWSATGNRLAFLADVAGEGQIFVLELDGGEAKQITHAARGVQAFAWRPDGKALGYIARDAAPKREKFDDSFEVEANDFLMQSGTEPAHLWTIDPSGDGERRLTSGHWSVSGNSFAWSASGDRIAFVSQPSAGTRDSDKRSIEMVPAEGGAPSPVAALAGRHCSQPSFSPDGRWLEVTCPLDGHVKNQTELLILPAGGGELTRITKGIDRNFFRAVWTPDSKGLVSTAPDGSGTGLWTIPVEGTATRWQTGKVSPAGQGDVAVLHDGRVTFIGAQPDRPPELYVLNGPKSPPVRLTDFHAQVASMKLGRMEWMSWKSDDNLPLSGTVTFPPDFDPAKKYPLLLHIHGGPWGSSRETFSERSQMFASRGWIIFEPNYRGSDNAGNALFSAVYRDHGAGPGRDVMLGVEELKRRPYVDVSRIGVSGWSYGGYMTTWLIGHYQGWKAAMAGAAVIDLFDDYNLNDLRLFTRAFSDTLTSEKDLELMKEQSPLTYVDQMRTPLLMISDARDMRVPVTQSYELLNALRERGQDVRMRLYPVGGHIPADPYRARDVDRRWAEWFSERLK